MQVSVRQTKISLMAMTLIRIPDPFKIQLNCFSYQNGQVLSFTFLNNSSLVPYIFGYPFSIVPMHTEFSIIICQVGSLLDVLELVSPKPI